MSRLLAPKKDVPEHLTPSLELPTAPGDASTPRALHSFQSRVSGIPGGQKIRPYPKRSHCQKHSVLSLRKPVLQVSHSSGRETDAGQGHSNREEGFRSQICIRPYLTVVELAEIVNIQLKQVSEDWLMIAFGGDQLNLREWLICMQNLLRCMLFLFGHAPFL